MIIAMLFSSSLVFADTATQRAGELYDEIVNLKEDYTTCLAAKKASSREYEEQIKKLKEENKQLKNTIALLKLTKQKPQERTTQEIALNEEKKVVLRKKETNVHVIPPTTFRTNKDAAIYNAPNGKKVAIWEKGTSFTSYLAGKKYIKITGYFVEKKWKKATKELWIQKKDAQKRK